MTRMIIRAIKAQAVALPVVLPAALPVALSVSLPVSLPVVLLVSLPVALLVALPVALQPKKISVHGSQKVPARRVKLAMVTCL